MSLISAAPLSAREQDKEDIPSAASTDADFCVSWEFPLPQSLTFQQGGDDSARLEGAGCKGPIQDSFLDPIRVEWLRIWLEELNTHCVEGALPLSTQLDEVDEALLFLDLEEAQAGLKQARLDFECASPGPTSPLTLSRILFLEAVILSYQGLSPGTLYEDVLLISPDYPEPTNDSKAVTEAFAAARQRLKTARFEKIKVLELGAPGIRIWIDGQEVTGEVVHLEMSTHFVQVGGKDGNIFGGRVMRLRPGDPLDVAPWSWSYIEPPSSKEVLSGVSEEFQTDNPGPWTKAAMAAHIGADGDMTWLRKTPAGEWQVWSFVDGNQPIRRSLGSNDMNSDFHGWEVASQRNPLLVPLSLGGLSMASASTWKLLNNFVSNAAEEPLTSDQVEALRPKVVAGNAAAVVAWTALTGAVVTEAWSRSKREKAVPKVANNIHFSTGVGSNLGLFVEAKW